jgi:hypothetical protein
MRSGREIPSALNRVTYNYPRPQLQVRIDWPDSYRFYPDRSVGSILRAWLTGLADGAYAPRIVSASCPGHRDEDSGNMSELSITLADAGLRVLEGKVRGRFSWR